MSQSLAFFELLTSTMIWGFGFTATVWALEYLDPATLSVSRFFIAFTIGWLFLFLNPKTRQSVKIGLFRQTFWAGTFLGLTLVLQTWGLLSTSATNSAFLTTLYVVLVPLIDALIRRHRPDRLHMFWVTVALIGTVLLVELHDLHLSKGDLLTLACALTAAIHILIIDRVADAGVHAFTFNTGQSFWAALVALMTYPFMAEIKIETPQGLALLGFLSLTFGSTMLAFALQIKAQRHLTASVSSVIFLLESPFSMFFAFLLLNETFTKYRLLGAFLIFVAALGATYTEHKKRERHATTSRN